MSERWVASIAEQLQRDETVQIESMRAASPLALIAVGLEPVTPVRFVSTKEGVRFGEARGASSAVDALFGHLDLVFVIGTIVSLLTLSLASDTICGERKDGTLAIVLSYPVTRSTVFLAKVIAASFAGGVCACIGTFVAVVIHVGGGLPIVSVEVWALFLLLCVAYVCFFAIVGVAVSASAREPADALIVCLSLWVLLVFVAPRIVAVTVSSLVPPRRAASLALELDAAISKLKIAKSREDAVAYERYLARSASAGDDVAELRKTVAESTNRLGDQRRKLVDRMLEREQHEEELRDVYLRRLSVLSPPALFQEASAELARTGRIQRRRFYRDARIYDDEIGRRLIESRHMMSGGMVGGESKAVVIVDDIKPFMIPFTTRWVEQSEPREIVAATVFLFAAASAAVFFMGRFRFRRLDARP
jgi:ABC-type multidrug transport system permease subunit